MKEMERKGTMSCEKGYKSINSILAVSNRQS